MTKVLHQSMFGFLSALLLALLFVITPSDSPEVARFQGEVRKTFASAAWEIWGEQSVAEPFALIWTATQNFYGESADQAIALLQPVDAVTELALMFDIQYYLDVNTYSAPMIARAPFEAPLYNIIPMPDDAERLLDPEFSEDFVYQDGPEGGQEGQVLGEATYLGREEGLPAPQMPGPPVVWMDIADSITGETHCVAVFNGTVNSYPGPCAREKDRFDEIYEN